MTGEVNQAKRYLGARFGYGEHLPPGTYAVPTNYGSKPAFMRLVVNEDGTMGGFHCFWDEALTHACGSDIKPENNPTESKFAAAFRQLEAARK